MSKFFHLTKKASKCAQKRRGFCIFKINLKFINICLIGLILLVAVSYLVTVNGLSTKGYQIKELESKIAELQDEKEDLEVEVLTLQSMGNVKEKVTGLGLVKADNNEFLNPTPVALAR